SGTFGWIERMDFLQFMIGIPWFGGGLLFWPALVVVRGSSDTKRRRLRRIFFVTLAALAILGASLGIVALLGRFDHNWLPVTLLFPIINLVSITFSIRRLARHDQAAEQAGCTEPRDSASV